MNERNGTTEKFFFGLFLHCLLGLVQFVGVYGRVIESLCLGSFNAVFFRHHSHQFPTSSIKSS